MKANQATFPVRVMSRLLGITPGQVRFTLESQASIADVHVTNLTIVPSRTAPTGSLYGPPKALFK